MGDIYLAGETIADNDRLALRLTPPWHAETITNERTGAVLFTACDCPIGADHAYAQRYRHLRSLTA
ncbi:hypothetical protein [Gryllotalpicola ginsengisoli]|uniref:hypothetical protein n=1 Tax=Gryllotalpicola ginsengisoli TaxID=444608 RepID=UPI0003B3842F|nr:hypothetical protein [Gryllotalpicola ginsengisoli]